MIFGLPIWYFTTSTYRAPLPFNEIYEISEANNLELQITFELVYMKNGISTNDLKNIREKLISDFSKGIKT